MLKIIFTFIFGLMFLQYANGQHHKASDTLVYYLNHNGQIAQKYYADHIVVILPADSSTGTLLYPVIEYNMNGKPLLTGISIKKDFQSLFFEGPVTSYYTNGQKQSVENYVDGKVDGEINQYYPNGQLYTTEIFRNNGQHFLIACYDTVGTILTQNGNGKWMNFDINTSQLLESGMVKDSLEEGDWHEFFYKSVDYITIYHKGIIISSTDPARQAGGEPIFSKVEQQPKFNGDFGNFLAKHVKYPIDDLQNNIQGKVILTFIVEKDGSLNYIKVVKAPDRSLADEAARVLELSSPWIPGQQAGRPARVHYITPISFSIGSSD
jgi:TonB family protein